MIDETDNLTDVAITCVGRMGKGLRDIAFDACMLAKKHGLIVVFMFHDIRTIVSPEDYMNINDVCRKIQLEEEGRQRIENKANERPEFS